MLKKLTSSYRIIAAVCLLLAAILSISVLSPILSSPEFHAEQIELIDDKKMVAMSMSAAVTAASVAITAIPDDMGTTVADELDDLTAILFLIVCVLYLEKYMLTILSFFSFSGLIPAACVLLGINLFLRRDSLRIWTNRLIALSLVFICIVPLSVGFTAMLDETFSESIDQTFDAVYRIVEIDAQSDENTNAFVKFFESVKETVVDTLDAAKKMLSLFIDAVAILVVTSCLIPLLTAFIFVWSIKTIFRVPMDVTKTLKSAQQLIKKNLPKNKNAYYIEEPKDDIAS